MPPPCVERLTMRGLPRYVPEDHRGLQRINTRLNAHHLSLQQAQRVPQSVREQATQTAARRGRGSRHSFRNIGRMNLSAAFRRMNRRRSNGGSNKSTSKPQ